MNHYTYRAEWSAEHGEYVGRCIELSWLSRWAPTMQEAIAGVEQAVDEFIAGREAADEDVPVPLTERQYSGKFVVRTLPALHARLEDLIGCRPVCSTCDIAYAIVCKADVSLRSLRRAPRVPESRPSARGRPPPR
jgi:predicted RNase H-like HicB family nuclease